MWALSSWYLNVHTCVCQRIVPKISGLTVTLRCSYSHAFTLNSGRSKSAMENFPLAFVYAKLRLGRKTPSRHTPGYSTGPTVQVCKCDASHIASTGTVLFYGSLTGREDAVHQQGIIEGCRRWLDQLTVKLVPGNKYAGLNICFYG